MGHASSGRSGSISCHALSSPFMVYFLQIKPKHLKDLKLESSLPSKTDRVGLLERKHASYDVWSLGNDQPEHIGGEEIKALSCLLPRKRKDGKLQSGTYIILKIYLPNDVFFD